MKLKLTWKNEMGPRSRKAHLLLIGPNGELTWFRDESIPKKVAVLSTAYKKNGKWSHTVFDLQLAEGWRALSFHDGWETGRLSEGLARALGSASDALDAILAKLPGATPESLRAAVEELGAKKTLEYWASAATAIEALGD